MRDDAGAWALVPWPLPDIGVPLTLDEAQANELAAVLNAAYGATVDAVDR